MTGPTAELADVAREFLTCAEPESRMDLCEQIEELAASVSSALSDAMGDIPGSTWVDASLRIPHLVANASSAVADLTAVIEHLEDAEERLLGRACDEVAETRARKLTQKELEKIAAGSSPELGNLRRCIRRISRQRERIRSIVETLRMYSYHLVAYARMRASGVDDAVFGT